MGRSWKSIALVGAICSGCADTSSLDDQRSDHEAREIAGGQSGELATNPVSPKIELPRLETVDVNAPVWVPPTDWIGVGDAAEDYSYATAVRLGYRRLRINGQPALGERPLMVIQVSFSDAMFTREHSPAYFEQLFFGPGFPNINDYYFENSQGLFLWRSAGVVGPFQALDDPNTKRDESSSGCVIDPDSCDMTGYGSGEYLRLEAIRRAVANGVSFAEYDTNRDGMVTQDELQIYVTTAWPDPNNRGGATRWTGRCVDAGPVRVCPAWVPEGSEHASFAMHTHELMHSLGTIDVYSGACNSANVTLMSCGDGQFHLDPLHKIQLGWVQPRFYSMADGFGSCAWMASQDRIGDPFGDPIVIGDMARDEFFIFEHRRATSYDRNVASEGMAIWHVKVLPDGSFGWVPGNVIAPGANRTIEARPAAGSDDWIWNDPWGFQYLLPGTNRLLETAPRADDVIQDIIANFTFGAPTAETGIGAIGGSRLWTRDHGAAELTRFDGSETQYWFRVGRRSADGRYLPVVWGESVFATTFSDVRFVDTSDRLAGCMLEL